MLSCAIHIFKTAGGHYTVENKFLDLRKKASGVIKCKPNLRQRSFSGGNENFCHLNM